VEVTDEEDGACLDDVELEEVENNPEGYDLILSGHNDHPACNGRYKYGGKANGKP